MNEQKGETGYSDHYITELGDNFTVKGMRNVNEFVRAVLAYGGVANTTEIREESGLSRSSYQHFYDKLYEFGIIDRDISRIDKDTKKVAIITEKGQDMWNKRVFDRWIDKNSSDSLPEPLDYDGEIQELRTRVRALEKLVEELQTGIK